MVDKVYQIPETAITWQDTGGTNAMTLNNLAAGAGRQGALHDLGTAAHAHRYAWRAFCQFATTPVVGEVVRIYLKTSDGTSPDNDDGTGDVAVSAEDKLLNLKRIGSIIVDQAATGVVMVASGFVTLPHRYVGPAYWNDAPDNLVATNNLNGFSLTPMPFEVQTA